MDYDQDLRLLRYPPKDFYETLKELHNKKQLGEQVTDNQPLERGQSN